MPSDSKDVLFFLKVPPPIHGSTLMNRQIMQSAIIHNNLSSACFPVSISKDVSDVGKFSLGKVRRVFRDYAKLPGVLRRAKPSLVYFAVSPYGSALLKDFFFYRIIRFYRIPVVFHHHGKGVKKQGERSTLFRMLYRSMFTHNFHICLAKELVSDIAGYAKTTPFIVPNGIADHGVRRSYELRDDKKVRILYLSNFTKSKGILVLLDAARLVAQHTDHFEISIIGKPYDLSQEEIETYIEKNKLTKYIVLRGPQYDDQKFRSIAEHDFLVFPTFYENETFGLVLIEAMQCGLPVISTHEGGIPSVVDDGETGFLIEKNNSQALAEKMLLLIKNPSKLTELGIKARKKYEENFTLDKFESGVLHVVNTLLTTLRKQV